MKSLLSGGARARLVVLAVVSSLAVALSVAGCAKDGESRSVEPRGNDPLKVPANDTQAGAKAPALPPAPAPAAGDQAGAAKPTGDHSYSIQVEAPASVAKGEEGVARVVITPKTGWKMNKEFPTRLSVSAPEGVRLLGKDQQQVPDAERFEEAGASFAVKFAADSPGAKSFQASFKFAVCTDTTCDPKKQELAWVVDVK